MKKHEMVLDFTSLLDVILIILFLVLCTMNGKAQKDAETIDSYVAENEELSTKIEQLQSEIENLTATNEEQKSKISELEGEIAELEEELADSATDNAKNAALIEKYEALIESYEKIEDMDSTERILYSLFKEKTIALELNLVKISKMRCDATLYCNGQKVGATLILNPSSANLDSNAKSVEIWLSSLLEQYVVDEEYKIAVLAVTYDGSEDALTGIQTYAYEAVDKAIYSIDCDRTKGYDLYHTTDNTKYINAD